MVHWQLCTLENLMDSGFGRPFPRHGLQLLFWFSNQCVTWEVKLVVTMKVTYFEVGNLNTETYPASANLPAYVRENYRSGSKGTNYNIDRIIIGYRVKTRVVETVYVTEHDAAMFGRFRSDRTYEISSELIQALQNPQLDLTTFLIQMGYYVSVVQGIEEIPYSDPPAQQMYNAVQNYSRPTAAAQQVYSYPCSYNQHGYYSDVTSQSRLTTDYYRYWQSSWEQPYEAFSEKPKKWDGGDGFSLLRCLLGAGALYLAAKCLMWFLRSWWNQDMNEDMVQVRLRWTPTFRRWTPSHRHTHIMLDYVF
ncbi:uncharacterized protein LOC115783239 isoform X2 [Archocentrus centrarchus]|uniref:uncharacterized protein LOC115783239 isoform X2 n=1 Tax=Archocentrus centrarchus TaxID=63155 RepID=UPI0011E9F67D|nr:uncharacterized protein LOC115783239 isoform X2 [Archocentrus centrarchus]